MCIKAASYPPDPAANRDVKNILVEHCVLWNAEPGNGVEIGYEVRCDEISDITFRDLDIVHCQYAGGVLTIHNADRASHPQHRVRGYPCGRCPGKVYRY